MELLRHAKRPLLNEAIYIVLNIALAVVVFVAVVISAAPWPALVFVALSKWRIFAVRPRYWFDNIKANLVDIIVSVSVVLAMFVADQIIMQIVLTVGYIAWLLLLKPRSKPRAMVAQAGVALFSGVTVLYATTFALPVSITVIGMWVIGYAVVRHVVSAHDEKLVGLYSLIGGFVAAEIGWFYYHWSVAYSLFDFSDLKIPQAAIILTLLGFVAERFYSSYRQHGAVRYGDVFAPSAFAVILAGILLTVYSGPGIDIF